MSLFFETPVFPECFITFGAAAGPRFRTEVVTLKTGLESRNREWEYPLLQFELSHRNRIQSERDQLASFFRLARGRARGFRVKDLSDYEVTTSNGVLSLISGNDYQLHKRYQLGSEFSDRIIQKPVSGSVTVYESSVEITTGITIDETTGIVTIDSGPDASNLSWEGTFDVPMRFTDDNLLWSYITLSQQYGHIYSLENQGLLEIRLPSTAPGGPP